MSSNLAPQTPALVTEIATQTKKKLGPLDLREFCGVLHRRLYVKRTSGLDQALVKMRDRKYRNRVRQPKLGDCKVIDTRRDASGKKLYFELSNGQAVRADKFAPTERTVRKGGVVVATEFSPAKSKNRLTAAIVAVEVALNASRKAA